MMRALAMLLCCATLARADDASTVFDKVSTSVVTIQVEDDRGNRVGSGSGLVEGPGSVVTNCHVVVEGERITVQHGGRPYAAQWVLRDAKRDLCALKVDGLSAPALRLRASNTLAVGETVHAVGNPLGFGLSVSSGTIAALAPFQGEARVVVTSAPISPGSSGGGLFDKDGRLVGVTTVTLGVGQSLNIALPAEGITELMKRGLPVRPKVEVARAAEPDWAAELEQLRMKRSWPELEALSRRFLERYPEGTKVMYLLGQALGGQQKWAAAREVLDKAFAIDGRDSQVLAARAWVRVNQDDYDGAEKDAGKSVKEMPGNDYAYWVLAMVHAKRGRHEEAQAAASKAAQLAPLSAENWNRLGAAHTALKQYDKAARAFRLAVQLDPKEPRFRANLAGVLAWQGKSGEAQQELQGANDGGEVAARTWLKVGLDALNAKRMTDAEQALRKALPAREVRAQAAGALIVVLTATDRLDEAEKMSGQMLGEFPNDPGLLHVSARIHHMRGRLEQAESLYEGLARIPEAGLDVLRELAGVQLQLRHFPKAEKTLAEVTRRDPTRAGDWGQLGQARVEMGDRAGAEAAAGKALALDPKSEMALLVMARLYGMSGDAAKALEYSERVLAINGSSAAAMSNKGYALFMLGRNGEAIQALETAVRLEPDFANPWINLGQAYLAAKQGGKAINALERATKLAPKAPDAHIYLAQAFLATQQTQKARKEVDVLRVLAPNSPPIMALDVMVSLYAGDRQAALAEYEKLKRVAPALATKLYQNSQRQGVPPAMALPQ